MSETAVGAVPLAPGFVQFYDGARPGLSAGTYRLTVTQSIDGLNTGSYFAPRSQEFAVDAPRFALEPGDAGERYPPADSAGAFGSTLPSIVLNRRTLPWERPLSADPAVPWLALLVFRPGELVPDPVTGQVLRSTTVAEFLTGTAGVLLPAIDRGAIAPELLHSTMTSVVVRREVFTALAPTLEEAKLLAHVRRTDTAAQASSDSTHDGWYSVVVGNRFPAADTATDGTVAGNLACLISLEGLTGFLPGGSGAPPRSPGQALRLAVLASWSFTANPAGGGDFGRLLAGLLLGPQQDPANVLESDPNQGPADLLLRVPTRPDAPRSAASDRLDQGYAALGQRLPTGEQTFAWYRGPFTAVPAQPLPTPADGSKHHSTAAQVTIYAQDEGVFDVSYAAAFEAGRLAALADRGFAVALVNARRAAHRTVGTLQARMNSPVFAAAAPDLAQLARPQLADQALSSELDGGLGDRLTEALSQVSQELGVAVEAEAEQPDAPPDPVEQLRALLARADVQELLAALVRGDAMDPVTDWLARLVLLHPIPFRHLVPDDRMLPVESLRFFYLDAGWLTALIDGALSIGVEGSRDLELQQAISDTLMAQVAEKTGKVRASRRNRPDLAVATGPAPKLRTGLLLRSALVTGWPGLTVQADGGGTALLRLDRLSDSVLLALFDGAPAKVSIGEPWHGLHFGFEDGSLHLRRPDGTDLGERFPAAGQPGVHSAFTRPVSPAGPISGVLDVHSLSTALLGRLRALIPGPAGAALAMGPALFATELLAGARRLTFHPAAPPNAPAGA